MFLKQGQAHSVCVSVPKQTVTSTVTLLLVDVAWWKTSRHFPVVASGRRPGVACLG